MVNYRPLPTRSERREANVDLGVEAHLGLDLVKRLDHRVEIGNGRCLCRHLHGLLQLRRPRLPFRLPLLLQPGAQAFLALPLDGALQLFDRATDVVVTREQLLEAGEVRAYVDCQALQLGYRTGALLLAQFRPA